MPILGITPKTGRIVIAAFGLLWLVWSARYFGPLSANPRYSRLPRPPQASIIEYPKIEELTAAAAHHHSLKPSKSWFFGPAIENAVLKSEEWFRLAGDHSATLLDPVASMKSGAPVTLETPDSNHGSDAHTGSDAGSFEEYVAPGNISVQKTTALAADNDLPSPTLKKNSAGALEQASNTAAAVSATSTPLILYAYSPASWALPNLQFFLKHGLHHSATFIFIVNGALTPGKDTINSSSTFVNSTEAGVLEVLDLLEPYAEIYPNVRIWKRPNTCYDLGAYAEVLKAESFVLVKLHETFILINASLRGPFVPYWSRECWSDAYLRFLNTRHIGGNMTTTGSAKLIGMTINCVDGRPRHIQSMILATDRVGMKILLGKGNQDLTATNSTLEDMSIETYTNIGIDACPTSMVEAVDIEVSLTTLIQSYNYTVRAMMAEYWSREGYELDCTNGDVNAAEGAYEGGNLGVFETLFIKTRWAVEADQTERLTQWYNGAVDSGMSEGAWERCDKGFGSA